MLMNIFQAMSGGPFGSTKYQLVQVHGHWGHSNNTHGSEHTINGRSYPSEMHFVHFNCHKYKDPVEASYHPDGLAVVAVFLKCSPKPPRNANMQKLIDDLNLIDYDDHDVPLDFVLQPQDLYPKTASERYMTYLGSLTTPPLSECVIWIVAAEPLEVTQDQLSHFHEIHRAKDGQLIERNFRPTQPINDRTVWASFPDYKTIGDYVPFDS